MHNHRGSRFVILAAVTAIALLVSCGPSSGQIRQAREARYDADAGVIWDNVLEAVGTVGKVEESDPSMGLIRTEAKWYEVDGTTARRDAEDNWMLGEGAVMFALLVGIKGEPGAWYVEVMPLALQHQSGSPQPRELAPSDPQMPGWVQGKVDNAYLAIHAQLKPFLVGAAPAPAPAP